jgi:hypothetical protein
MTIPEITAGSWLSIAGRCYLVIHRDTHRATVMLSGLTVGPRVFLVYMTFFHDYKRYFDEVKL